MIISGLKEDPLLQKKQHFFLLSNKNGLVALFNGIPIIVGYLMPKPFS